MLHLLLVQALHKVADLLHHKVKQLLHKVKQLLHKVEVRLGKVTIVDLKLHQIMHLQYHRL